MTTLRLQTRSAAALNAWMHVLQPVLLMGEMDAGGGDSSARDNIFITEAEQRSLQELLQLLQRKDAALEVAQGRTQGPGRLAVEARAAQ